MIKDTVVVVVQLVLAAKFVKKASVPARKAGLFAVKLVSPWKKTPSTVVPVGKPAPLAKNAKKVSASRTASQGKVFVLVVVSTSKLVVVIVVSAALCAFLDRIVMLGFVNVLQVKKHALVCVLISAKMPKIVVNVTTHALRDIAVFLENVAFAPFQPPNVVLHAAQALIAAVVNKHVSISNQAPLIVELVGTPVNPEKLAATVHVRIS